MQRPDQFYEITALTKGLVVLEALEGTAFEPVTVQRIIQRTLLPRDVVDRTLKTFRIRGWAVQNERGEWFVSARFVRFAVSVARHEEALNSHLGRG